jgi:hypothetical protein
MFTAEFRRRINGWRLAIQEAGRLAAPLLGAARYLRVVIVAPYDSSIGLCFDLADGF